MTRRTLAALLLCCVGPNQLVGERGGESAPMRSHTVPVEDAGMIGCSRDSGDTPMRR